MASFVMTRQEHDQRVIQPTVLTSEQDTTINPQIPSLHDRTLGSPPASPVEDAQNAKIQYSYRTPVKSILSPLTPPTSPLLSKSSTDLPSIMTQAYGDEMTAKSSISLHRPGAPNTRDSQYEVVDLQELTECPFDVQIVKDSTGGEQIYGRGAWSTVYRAIGRERAGGIGLPLPTPPSSPTISIPLIVAVKVPARRDAHAIIRNEGIILSHIARNQSSDQFVVPFHGFLSSTESLVLEPVPLSLHDCIQQCADRGSQTTSAWLSYEPVIGSTKIWLCLAEHMITALAWLHTEAGGEGIVHGDIKPGNILLAPNLHSGSDFAFTPLLADFSSSQLLSSSTITPNTLSAVTREYTAPELLSFQVLSDPNSVATTASDVFSLAVTLLVAATGELMVYPGSMWQRQAMAIQGWHVLDHVRNGDQGIRVPSHGIVDRVLEKAVLKAGLGRIDATSWCSLVEEIGMGEPVKKS